MIKFTYVVFYNNKTLLWSFENKFGSVLWIKSPRMEDFLWGFNSPPTHTLKRQAVILELKTRQTVLKCYFHKKYICKNNVMMKMLTECLFVKIPEPDNDMLKSTREIMDGKE